MALFEQSIQCERVPVDSRDITTFLRMIYGKHNFIEGRKEPEHEVLKKLSSHEKAFEFITGYFSTADLVKVRHSKINQSGELLKISFAKECGESLFSTNQFSFIVLVSFHCEPEIFMVYGFDNTSGAFPNDNYWIVCKTDQESCLNEFNKIFQIYAEPWPGQRKIPLWERMR